MQSAAAMTCHSAVRDKTVTSLLDPGEFSARIRRFRRYVPCARIPPEVDRMRFTRTFLGFVAAASFTLTPAYADHGHASAPKPTTVAGKPTTTAGNSTADQTTKPIKPTSGKSTSVKTTTKSSSKSATNNTSTSGTTSGSKGSTKPTKST